jgi:succinyl-diaminopimelate desuccinylase
MNDTPPLLTAGDAAAHLARLIQCPSVTPNEGGALDYLTGVLSAAGFACHRLKFSSEGTPDVDNLFAVIGSGSPHLCFAGHTDVVPPGDEAAWTHPPFVAYVADGNMYGRGAADMKGGIAAFVAAALRYLHTKNGQPAGSISFLITGDEEGPAINGTQKVLTWMQEHGYKPDHCLLGEPTNPSAIGQELKIGRRGSYSARLTVRGVQGHVAYPQFFRNPLTGIAMALARLKEEPVDSGSTHFSPSNFEITSIDTGNPATNVVPAQVTARINIRYNDLQTPDSLVRWLHERTAPVMQDLGLEYEYGNVEIADNFYTPPGPWVEVLAGAIREVTGITPEYSTKGGASDGRFIKDCMPVVEFGLCNTTIHKVDEHVPLSSLALLSRVYEVFLSRYFA